VGSGVEPRPKTSFGAFKAWKDTPDSHKSVIFDIFCVIYLVTFTFTITKQDFHVYIRPCCTAKTVVQIFSNPFGMLMPWTWSHHSGQGIHWHQWQSPEVLWFFLTVILFGRNVSCSHATSISSKSCAAETPFARQSRFCKFYCFHWTSQKLKSFQCQGALHYNWLPHQGLCPRPCQGHSTQIPVIGSNSHACHGLALGPLWYLFRHHWVEQIHIYIYNIYKCNFTHSGAN